MKKIKIYTLTLLLGFVLQFNSYAQFIFPAVLSDITAMNTGSVENTGNDLRGIGTYPTNDMMISTWDGDMPGFAWEDQLSGGTGWLKIAGTQLGTVWDPDIVLFQESGNMYTLIVYLLNDNVFYETWIYSQSNNNWNVAVPPTPINANGNCHNPNVDIDKKAGKTAVIYEQNSKILVHAGDIMGNFGPAFWLYSGAHTPDVSMNYVDPPGGNSYWWMNCTFIGDNGSIQELLWIDEPYSAVAAGGSASNSPVVLDHTSTLNGSYFGRPRIAGPSSVITPQEWEIVVHHLYNGRYYIKGYNHNNPSPYIINKSATFDLTSGLKNLEPAVSYTHNNIIVTWTYDDGYNYISNTVDVLSRQLLTNGTAPNVSPYREFSVVNQNIAGMQGVSSVCGRFSISNPGLKMVTFRDFHTGDINYKSLTATSIQFRMSQPQISADMYPNPATDAVNIMIEEEFTSGTIDIFNMQGQLVFSQELSEQQNKIDVSSFVSGIYSIRVATDNGSKIKLLQVL